MGGAVALIKMSGTKGKIHSKNPVYTVLGELPERKPLGEHVFDNLKQAILRGDLPPDSRLIESRIADAMGISRTPVREAIHKLEKEGLLKKLPGGSFFVVELTQEDIEETFGIRSVLESYAARMATLNHHEEDLLFLEKKIEEYQDCLDRGQMERLPDINTEIHDYLYELSQSPILTKMIGDLSHRIYRFRKILLKNEKRASISNKDHQKMLKAMKKRDAERVEQLVKEHVLRAKKMVLTELRNHPEKF